MQFPTLSEYCDALLLDLGDVLSDPVLNRGSIVLRAPGRPVVHGGTYSFTFEVATDAGHYALRCFRRDIDRLEQRWRALQAHLALVRSPHFVAFDFQDCGITTESGRYPVVRMDWVEGPSLATYVARHRRDSAALQRLRLSLRHLAQHLRLNGIAHGDLQPSNIIVQEGGHLRLIDYDGMFVPGLESFGSIELGQRNFQHPQRLARHFDATLDAFTFQLLDVALHALEVRPELWELTASREDAFLLRAGDFIDPGRSAVFERLSRDPLLAASARDLAAICQTSFERIPSFEDFLARRNLPTVPLEFRRADLRHARDDYLRAQPVVHAADFARCCKHVGEWVELVGCVARVAPGAVAGGGEQGLRLEFDEATRDRACLSLWPEALSRFDAAPDLSWVGQWVSAVGLVEPVARDGGGAPFQKTVSIAIDEPHQLQRITEAEAHRRLHMHGIARTRRADEQVAVRTDPVRPQAPSPRPEPVTTPVPPAPVQDPERMPRRSTGERRGWSRPLAAAVALVAVAIALAVMLKATSDHDRRVDHTVAPAVAAPPPTRTFEPSAVAALESQRILRATDVQIDTRSGTLRLVQGSVGDCRHAVMLGDHVIRELCDDVLTWVHQARFTDRDVVTAFAHCDADALDCERRRPLWIELRPGQSPAVRRGDGLVMGAGATNVVASEDGVRVRLGLWDGERRVATYTAAGNVVLERSRESIVPLDEPDCAAVARSLESCAASHDCRSFARIAEQIPAAQRAILDRLYHATTGLDAGAFRRLCVRSCQLGLSPSAGLVRRYACGGARAEQWLAGEFAVADDAR